MKLRYFILLSIVFFLYSVSFVPNIFKTWEKKISQQHRSNMMARNSNELYASLSNSIINDWPSLFKLESEIDSLISLNDTLNISTSGLVTPTQLLSQPILENVTYSGSSIGLTKLCVKNSPHGFIVGSNEISTLMQGLKILESRVDIELSNFVYINELGYHQLIFDQLCLLVSRGDL